jgi:hypothetical protein
VNAQTLLYRQVHPAFTDNSGKPTSQVFTPNSGLLSIYDGSLISAQAAWTHYTTILNLQSVGVIAVTVAECLGAGLRVYSDPQPNFDEHSLIDFRRLSSTSQGKRTAKKLLDLAVLRSWLFQAPS